MASREIRDDKPMPEEDTPIKQTRAPGERSRARIVERAAQLATIEGIEGLSIGELADATGTAKSTVYALFGSKERTPTGDHLPQHATASSRKWSPLR